MSIEMPLHTAIVSDLQYLYAILALNIIPGILKFFLCIIMVPMQDCHLRTVTHSRCVHNSAFLAAPPTELTEYERKRVFFIPPSVGSFSSPGKSFCILKYLASLGFANILSINVMLFLNFSLPQYI